MDCEKNGFATIQNVLIFIKFTIDNKTYFTI